MTEPGLRTQFEPRPDLRPPVAVHVRRAIAVAILAISAAAAVLDYARAVAGGGQLFQTMDWMINYAGGFVRRGLFGELLLAIVPDAAAASWALFALQLTLYGLLFWYTLRFLSRAGYSWTSIALACGPAALPFIGWDTGAGFRKEILGFVVLVMIALARQSAGVRPRSRMYLLWGGAVTIWGLAMFSWEGTAVMLPAVLFLLFAPAEGLPPRQNSRWTLAAAFSVPTIAGVIAAALAPGTPATVEAVCQDLIRRGFAADACSGAVAWLGKSTGDSLAMLGALPAQAGYLVVIPLALLPLFLAPWLRSQWRWALVCAAAIGPLFLLGADYGRWTHILVMELTICLMAGSARMVESALWNPLSTLLFVSLVGIPHWSPSEPWPFLGLVSRAIGVVVKLAELAGIG